MLNLNQSNEMKYYLKRFDNTKRCPCLLKQVKMDSLSKGIIEWVSTARNLIARQSIGQHFWQEINCSTQNFSNARIELSRAQPDSTS
jgi:hypothetical protein